MTLDLESPAFADGSLIPTDATEDGLDQSPTLSWLGVPPETVEFALVLEDLDAPAREPWVHWLVWKIPPTWSGLPAGFHGRTVPEKCESLRQGMNTWGTPGYRGPAPPRGGGPHHYHFRLFALEEPLVVPAGANKRDLMKAIKHHTVAEAKLVGIYERTRKAAITPGMPAGSRLRNPDA